MKKLLLIIILSCIMITIWKDGKMEMCQKCCDHNGNNCTVSCL